MVTMKDQRTRSVPIWGNQIQCYRVREKSGRPKATQIEVNVTDAIINSPPYISRTDTSNTMNEDHECDICKCYDKKPQKDAREPKSWQSITNLYGDVDTTEVWDDVNQAPQPVYKSTVQEVTKKIKDAKAVKGNKITKSQIRKKGKKEKSIINSHKIDQFAQNTEFYEPVSDPSKKKNQPKSKNISKIKKSVQKTRTKNKPTKSDQTTLKFNENPMSSLDPYINLNPETDYCNQITCKNILENLRESQKLTSELKGEVKNKIAKINKTDMICKCKIAKAKTEKTSEKRSPDRNEAKRKNDQKLYENYLPCMCKHDKPVNNDTSMLPYTDYTKTNIENVGIGDQVRHTEKDHKQLKERNQPIFKFKKKPKPNLDPKTSINNRIDLCSPSTCKEIVKHLYRSQKLPPELLKSIRNNNANLIGENVESKLETLSKDKTQKNNESIEIDDQLKEIKRNVFENKCSCSIRNKIFQMFRSKPKVFKDQQQKANQEVVPLFEIKVDSRDMHVINTTEIRNKVKSLGKPAKNCVCPTRIKKLKKNVCESGVCEMARINKDKRFLCNCPIKETLECRDSTCNDIDIASKTRKQKTKKVNNSFRNAEITKPMFEVVLDDTNMSLVNSREIIDIFKKASKDGICPDGICRTIDGNIPLNCKCVNKKIHQIPECSEGTCFVPPYRKTKLSYLCSRIFSKSDNWTKPVPRQINYRSTKKQNTYTRQSNKRTINTKSDTFRKRAGLNIDIPRNHILRRRDTKDLSEIWCKCFCECDKIRDKTQKQKALKKKNKEKKNKEKKNKKKKGNKKQGKKSTIPPEDMTCEERIIYCIEESQRKCEEALEEKEKLYIKQEKKEIKDAIKQAKLIKEHKRRKGSEWNCLTNFMSGSLNLFVQTITKILGMPFRTLADPIGSFVYVRQKARNPVLAVSQLFSWISRTWKSKNTYISSVIKRSHAMNVIADHLEDMPVFETISSRGKTKDERAEHERLKNIRKRRMEKRHNEAVYGCRHMLLVTMRKTPCIWFYHICPDMYPQCLSLVSFLNNFFHIIVYIVAVLCWTPCILTFEICRAFLCCFLCTH